MKSLGTTRRRRKLMNRSKTISIIRNEAAIIGMTIGPPASSISNRLRVGIGGDGVAAKIVSRFSMRLRSLRNTARRQGVKEAKRLAISPDPFASYSPCLLAVLRFRLWLPGQRPGLQLAQLELRVAAGVDVSDHVQVVMVDVDDFFGLFIAKRVWHGPADAANVFVINRALVMSMVVLSGANERIHAWRVDVVSNLAFYDSHMVAIAFPHAGNTALDRVHFFEGTDDFVVTRWIQRDWRTAGGDRSQDWHAIVPFVFPVL